MGYMGTWAHGHMGPHPLLLCVLFSLRCRGKSADIPGTWGSPAGYSPDEDI